jgi:putative ABC transport system ATP-binding protein
MIRCQDITKSYIVGDMETQVLKGVSFTINDGEFVAITGPSGSGKSTLMNIIGALDSPTSGQYFLDEEDVSGLSDDELAAVRCTKIGFVFQSFNLLSRTTVLRNVMLPLVYAETPRAKREEIAYKALRASGLPEDRWHNLSNQLSGGQMQRVAIARSLVNDPTLILADEPTGNLDSKTGQFVLQTFKDLNKNEKRTIVLITHDMNIAQNADRIIILKDGLITDDNKIKH